MDERALPSGIKHGFAPIPTADSIFVSTTVKSVVAMRSEWQQNKHSGEKFCSVVITFMVFLLFCSKNMMYGSQPLSHSKRETFLEAT
jgi:hypothetical protein